MKLLRKLLFLSILFIGAATLFAFGYYFAVTKDTELSPEKLIFSEKNLVLYDKDDQIADIAPVSHRQPTAFSALSKETVDAFVSVEDKRFFSHNGFDVKRIVKAVYNNAKTRSFKEGASTISQQLIKNTHLSQEKTLKRKLREWKLTRALEKRYSKQEILEKYLSVIYFGHDCFGIRAAAKFYFGKTPSELDLADSAILAGLVKSPNNYSPFKNATNCLKRKESVLNLMLKNGVISETDKRAAMQKPLPLAPNVNERKYGYAHYVFDELSTLAERYAFPVGGNVEIYTALDPVLQSEVERIGARYTKTDKIISVLDVQTRNFKACVSTVGNVKRLPGSLLKPLLVYAPALEEDFISPATPLLDEKIDYNGYSPKNFDDAFHGYLSARECLSKSLNVPAVKLLNGLGVEKCAGYLSKIGLTVPQEDYSLALALGGMKNGYTLRELMSAYCTLPNGGNYGECAFIRKIVVNGNEVYRRSDETKKAFSEESAYLTTDMLKTAATTGTAKKLRSLPFEIAAKTGTAGTNNGNTDAYALSYTTRDCVGVWLGNAQGGTIDYTGGGVPCNILLDVNERLFASYQAQNQPVVSFPLPKKIRRVALDKISYYDTHTLCLADDNAPAEYHFFELFKESAIPTKKCDFFTHPSILQPLLQYKNGEVVITFDKTSPTFYRYKIERYDYATHSTLYAGEFLQTFKDKGVEKNKNYVYTVTPYYKDVAGEPIVLPSVSTKTGVSPSISDGEIIGKDWWDY